MSNKYNAFQAWRKAQGVTAIEYALIASLIVLVIVTGIALLGSNLAALYDQVQTSIVNALQ